MSNHATAAPVRATSKSPSRKNRAATSPADCRPEVIAQLEQLGEQLGSIYIGADKLHKDAWFLMGQAGDAATGIVTEYRRDPTDSAGLLARVEDFRAYWRGAKLVLLEESVDALPEDVAALGVLRRHGDVMHDLLVSLRAQCEAEGAEPERPRAKLIEPGTAGNAAAPKKPTVDFIDQANNTFRKVRAALILLDGAITSTDEPLPRLGGIVGTLQFMRTEMNHLRELCEGLGGELSPLYWSVHHAASILEMLEEHEYNNAFQFELTVPVYVDLLFAARCDIEAGQAALVRMEAA